MKTEQQTRPIVLAVNDELKVLELLTVLLEREGYKVLTADGGARALELASVVEPDIIISDIVMPEMDGLEFCRRLKQNPQTAHVPVLLASAVHAGPRGSFSALTAGADDFLEMPFRRQELLIKVARLTERHRIERRYRELVEQAADIIYTRDLDGRITSINEAGARFFGRPVSELVGAPLGELLGAEAAAEILARKPDEAPGDSMTWVHRVKDGRGVPHYLEGMMTFVRDGEGRPVSVRSVVRDITERKLTEEALRESEERFKAFMDNSPAVAFIKDDEGRYVYVNRPFERFFNATLSDLRGKTDHTLWPTEIVEQLRENDKAVIASGKSREVVETVPAPDGVLHHWLVFKFPLKDAQERWNLAGMAVDITERKSAEEALRESEERYRDLFENANDIIYTHDLDGNFTSLNKSGERITGYTRAEAVRMNFAEVVVPEQMEKAREMLVRKSGEAAPTVYEFEIISKDGRRVPLEISTRLIRKDGKPIAIQGIARDITERKRSEEILSQQVEREAVINRISLAVRRSLDPVEVFRTAVRELGSYLSVDRCSIYMKDEEAGRLRLAAEYHAQGVSPADKDFPLARIKELADGITRHGALAFDDAASDERLRTVYKEFLRPTGVRSILYVGIKAGDETPAAFALSTTTALRHWRKEDIALARAVADQTGIAIRQAELFQKAATTSARESLINRLSLAIRASLSLPEVLSTATRELGRALNASRVHLHLYDPLNPRAQAEHEYVAATSSNIKHLEMSFDGPIGQRVLRSPGPIVIADALNYEDGPAEFNTQVREHAVQVRLRSEIICPLIVNGRFRGALCIHQTDRIRRWSEDEVTLVEAVAAQLATGIAQAELFEMTGRAKKEWETTFNAMSDGIFIFDNAGQLIRVNRAGAAMEDTWPHLMLGRRCCDILRTSEDNACIVEQTINEGRSVTVEVVPERFNRPLLVTVEPIIEKGSRTIGAVCTARDLSELRKAEAKAREQQSLLMNILESARESIYAVDTEGRFQWCNSATVSATGYKSEELIGKSFLDITFEADRETAHEHFRCTLEGKPQTYEARFFSHDGQLRYALFDTAPLVVDGYTTGVLGIARDITEQKQERQRAAQADKLRALGQLASGVAHDFNNALTAILGRAQLMRRQVDDDALVHNLNVIQTAAEDAAATVRRIQTFARQSPAKEFELLDASRLLRDAVEFTRTRWENEARLRGLSYDVQLHADGSQHIMGNASELREVFVNLIVNAVDAMPQGGRLSISCERAGGNLVLKFKDTGMGMPEEVRERIFEPFYTTKGAQGTGLGLAVSYGIIERHEGHFNVESEVNGGTTFEINLPAADPASGVEKTVSPRYETPAMRMLVIDDEEFVRETLADMLTMLGHEVTVASGGRAALEEIEAREFDLVFTDLSMPEMDGWEVAREVRRRRPEISILLVTGHGTALPIAPGDKHLVNGIIGKPFDFDQVTEMIGQATEKPVAR